MSRMFASYDNPANATICKPEFYPQLTKQTVTPLIDIKGKFLGVKVAHAMPFRLYFHLENFNVYDNADLLTGKAVLEVFSLTNKSVLQVDYLVSDILNQYTNDLCIDISQEEAKLLRKETYTMRLVLKTADYEYQVFSSNDGYLVIR